VITDLVMPNVEGLETIRAIRQRQSGLRVIAVSGAFGDYLRIAEMLGADKILRKPVAPEHLVQAVQDLLN